MLHGTVFSARGQWIGFWDGFYGLQYIFISETCTVTPQPFCLFGKSWSIPNCSKSLKKSEHGKILGVTVLKRKFLNKFWVWAVSRNTVNTRQNISDHLWMTFWHCFCLGIWFWWLNHSSRIYRNNQQSKSQSILFIKVDSSKSCFGDWRLVFL